MVSTSAPSALSARMVQDLTARPLTLTTQAPHWEVSQPTWVPVSRRFSRRNWTNSVRGSISALTALPFTDMETVGITLLPFSLGPDGRISSLAGRGRPPQCEIRAFGADFQIGARRSLYPTGWCGQETCHPGWSGRRIDRLGELGEELVGHLLGRAHD